MIRPRTISSIALAIAIGMVPGAATAQTDDAQPDGWLASACAVIVPLDESLGQLAALGQASMQDDLDGLVEAGGVAASAAQGAADALDAEVLGWQPGSNLVNSLRTSVFGVLAVANDLADEGAAGDPARLRGGLASLIQAYSWRLESEWALVAITDVGSAACEDVELPTPAATPLPLAELFPGSIGGETLEVNSSSGSMIFTGFDTSEPRQAAALAALQSLIEERGKTPVDLSAGIARLDSGARIVALRLLGVPAEASLDALHPIVTASFQDPRSTPTTVDGVELVILSDGPADTAARRLYAYLQDDVVWAMVAEGEILSEVLAALTT